MNLRTTGMEFASEMVIKATLVGLVITEVPTTLDLGRSPWVGGDPFEIAGHAIARHASHMGEHILDRPQRGGRHHPIGVDTARCHERDDAFTSGAIEIPRVGGHSADCSLAAMSDESPLKPATRAITAGRAASGASLAPALWASTVWESDGMLDARRRATRTRSAEFYGRYANPTVSSFEDAVASLEPIDVTTGWFDDGLVAGGKNKLVPSVSMKLRNKSGAPLESIQINAILLQAKSSFY